MLFCTCLKFLWEVCYLKSTGIVRKVDELGRVVLPIELRRSLNIDTKDSLEIFVDDEKIVLKKYEPADIFTGEMDNLIDYKGKKVSIKSILEMAEIANLKISK
ncbi:AbrB/MazE/SpoVT family DNA-binding domain-containing protein [Anaerotignum faecicola]|nr:AbrB/MazE/SpoVT family DNA-binding domain-containing protein [Anaerotignum faecicola]